MKKIKAFDVINVLLMILLGAITLIPVLTVVAKAFSDPTYVIAGRVGILPKGFQLDTIRYVLNKPEFLNAFKNSIFVTGVGTTMAMFMTVSAAYPLSKPELRGRKFFLYIFVFVMLFGAGMVPSYLLYNSLHLLNTRWALIFASGFSVFNLLVVKNYFEQLPESIEEAARIDGASNMQILFRVVLPMSAPVLATVALFYAVGYWNNYFSGVMYITKPELRTLQHYLYDLLRLASQSVENAGQVMEGADSLAAISSESITSATIVISTVPILVLYPLLQKHFVKGITIGSVKG